MSEAFEPVVAAVLLLVVQDLLNERALGDGRTLRVVSSWRLARYIHDDDYTASLSEAKSRLAGRCAACGGPVHYTERVVHLYGEAFHHDCAFYTPLRNRDRHGRRAHGPRRN
jgi:hypothetical protein